MKHAKTIQLYLMDGKPTGRIKASLANWTGMVIKIPRIALESCSKDAIGTRRSYFNYSGVYFLFGEADEAEGLVDDISASKGVVYIGQANSRKNGEGILNRLVEHRRNPDKSYWKEAVVLTTSNNSLSSTEISYLENRFCQMAKEADRYQVKNSTEPSLGNISEEKESELEEFIEYAQLVVGSLGFKVFTPMVETPIFSSTQASEVGIGQKKAALNQNTILYLKRAGNKSKKEIVAQGQQTSDGFVLLKGSEIERIDSSSVQPKIKALRQTAKIDVNNILQEDILFGSPSYAGSFVLGTTCNGQERWKNEQGVSLRDLEESI